MMNGTKWLLICGLAGVLPVSVAAADDNVAGSPRPMPTETTTPAPSETATPPATAPIAPAKGTVGDPSWTVFKLHHINQMEIKVGKLEEQNGESSRVKQYAARLVRDHQAADRDLMAYARKHKVTMSGPGVGQPENKENTAGTAAGDEMAMQAETKRLESLKGAELDRAFLTSMLSGHDAAIDFVRSARGATNDTDLAKLLDDVMPSLQKHRDMAATLNNALHGTSMQ